VNVHFHEGDSRSSAAAGTVVARVRMPEKLQQVLADMLAYPAWLIASLADQHTAQNKASQTMLAA